MTETADWYRRFADREAAESPTYRAWALGVAGDPVVLGVLDALPLQKRQPNLLFAVSRLLGAPVAGYQDWREWLLARADSVLAEARRRSTQTNEPRRTAATLPVLAGLPQPLALLEVGASAGLCLYPDRYGYRYSGGPLVGDDALVFDIAAHGPVPRVTRPPEIVWRAGLDLDPLDVLDPGDRAWLRTLVWPEQHERLRRLDRALSLVREDPPRIVRGDAVTGLAAVAADAPAGATLVVLTTGVLAYLTRQQRDRFAAVVAALDCTWVSLEAPGLVPGTVPAASPPHPGLFVLAADRVPLAWAAPHGQSLYWLEPPGDRPQPLPAAPG